MPPAIRSLSPPIAALALGLLLFAPEAHGDSAGSCTAVRIPTDSQDVTCALDPSSVGRPLHFVAGFGGSHDDTKITLDATLDGAPLTCEEGSKTSLFAEDGMVQLDCRFRVVAAPSGPAVPALLKVALTVHHAQYVSSSLDDE